MLEFVLWIGLALIAGGASAIQTVAQAVRDLQMSPQTARANRLFGWGGALSACALALSGALVFFALASNAMDRHLDALIAGLAILAVLLWREVANTWARRNLTRLVLPLFGDLAPFLPLIEPHRESILAEETRDDALEQMVEASEKVGLIEPEEHEMISGILELDRTLTREIMVPRLDVIALDAETPLRDALDVVIAGAHSRVPVYAGTIDHIIGLVLAKDLLKALREGKTEIALRDLLRPAYFVPETEPLDELLPELQRGKVHMAIVVDEYGGTAGIVTIEDVLEEIVGEIQDEYDTSEEPLIERVGKGEGIFNARVNIGEVNEALALDLPDEMDTLGGLVYQRLEKMPKVDDRVRVGDVTITVLSMVGRRIKKVRVAKAGEQRGGEQWAVGSEP